MFSTCNYAVDMSVMIQIRNVPEALHRRLKARAAEAGMSLSDYLLADLRRAAERPTPDELRERVRARPGVAPPPPGARRGSPPAGRPRIRLRPPPPPCQSTATATDCPCRAPGSCEPI